MTCAFLYPNRNKRCKNRQTNNICLFPSLLLLFFLSSYSDGIICASAFQAGLLLCWWGASVMLQENKKSHYYPFLQHPCWLQTCMEFHGSQALLKSQKKQKCGLVTRLCYWTAAFPVMNEYPSRHPNSNKTRVVFTSSFPAVEIKSSNASILLHSLLKSLYARTLASQSQ